MAILLIDVYGQYMCCFYFPYVETAAFLFLFLFLMIRNKNFTDVPEDYLPRCFNDNIQIEGSWKVETEP